MHVLLVEDDPDVQRTLTALLARHGHTVSTAENGLEAFAQLGAGGIDAILCDLALPFLQGNQFYAQVRENYPELARRVVFVSGFATDATTRRFLEETGQPFLGKPFESADVLAALARVSPPPAGPTAEDR